MISASAQLCPWRPSVLSASEEVRALLVHAIPAGHHSARQEPYREAQRQWSKRASGKPARLPILVDVDRLIAAYYDVHPDPKAPSQRSPSAHRAIAAPRSTPPSTRITSSPTTEAICRFRKSQGIDGPLSSQRQPRPIVAGNPNRRRGVVANGVDVLIDSADGLTPTPACRTPSDLQPRQDDRLADGIVVTPSHNPPEDGGFKYNPPNGGPADTT